jgi:hypothetical protein
MWATFLGMVVEARSAIQSASCGHPPGFVDGTIQGKAGHVNPFTLRLELGTSGAWHGRFPNGSFEPSIGSNLDIAHIAIPKPVERFLAYHMGVLRLLVNMGPIAGVTTAIGLAIGHRVPVPTGVSGVGGVVTVGVNDAR